MLDVTEQLSQFLWDHGDVAFAPLGKLMLENFKLEGARSRSKKKTVVSVKRLLQDLGGHQPWGQVASDKGWVGRPSWCGREMWTLLGLDPGFHHSCSVPHAVTSHISAYKTPNSNSLRGKGNLNSWAAGKAISRFSNV